MRSGRKYRNIPGLLHAPGLLAERPLIGVVLFIIGALVFSTLAFNVETKGPLLQWDVPLARTMHSIATNSPSYINELMLFGFFVGKELVQVIAIVLILYFIHKRLWREIAMIVIGLGGGAVIWYFLIHIFERARPEGQIGLIVTDPSFPSGHTITAVLGYGLLAYMLVPKMPNKFWKWFVIIASVLVMLFIGFSRLFSSGHYLTDLVAGYALGLAWGAMVYTTLEKLFD
jgi:undecaprenyl-diphosphatase